MLQRGIAFSLLIASAVAQKPATFDATWRDVAADYRELVESQQIVGSSLAFFHGTERLAFEMIGFADLDSERRVDEDTIYHWASITKTFTGIAIMQLRDRGKLTLDEPIVRYLPELRAVHDPKGWLDKVTLRHLMTHTSGFRGRTWPWGGEDWHPHEPTEWSQLVAMLPYSKIAFEPGSKNSYSNPGIIFLGRVIEILSGDDYEVYVQKNLFAPLGMTRAYFDYTPYHLLADRSNNYSIVRGEPVAGGLDFDTGITVSNGGLNAPIPDMLRYLRFLVGSLEGESAKSVLSAESLAEMRRPFLLTDGSESGMGLTWFLPGGSGVPIVGHTGGQKSFSSFVYVDPTTRCGCVAAFNTTGGRGKGSAFGRTRQRLFDEVFPLFRPATKPAHGK